MRLVVEVHEPLSILLDRRADGDHHVVGPEHAAALRPGEPEAGFHRVAGEDVAAPHHSSGDGAVHQVAQVAIGNYPDLPCAHRPLEHGYGSAEFGGGKIGWITPLV